MSLRCPSCSSKVRRPAAEMLPIPGAIYQCPVCRHELVLSEDGNQMLLAPERGDKLRETRKIEPDS